MYIKIYLFFLYYYIKWEKYLWNGRKYLFDDGKMSRCEAHTNIQDEYVCWLNMIGKRNKVTLPYWHCLFVKNLVFGQHNYYTMLCNEPSLSLRYFINSRTATIVAIPFHYPNFTNHILFVLKPKPSS